MASRAGYQPLPQTIEEESDVGEYNANEANNSQLAPPASAATRGRRRVRPGSIDLTKLDTAFKSHPRWTESIAQKMKRKKKESPEQLKKPIWRSVFEPQYQLLSIPTEPVIALRQAQAIGFLANNLVQVKTLDHKPPMTQVEYDALVQSVKSAINEGVHPKMITKGSSGSYFARAKTESGRVQTVAVFKPKDEEPYGRLNPKTTKWIHRQLRWIIPFGRACLIPNLSYISEAAASLLDTRLNLHIVPPTQLVSLSSPAFFYDWIDRTAAKKGKPLPEKIGSMQVFLHGYQDASEFLRKHPWPGRAIADTFDDSNHRQANLSTRVLNALKIVCGRTGDPEDVYDEAEDDDRMLFDSSESDIQRPFYWSQALQQSFREELEKLVILDYLMLNTDRGADNYMIKYCEGEHEKLVDVAPSRSTHLQMPVMSELRRSDSSPNPQISDPARPSALPLSSDPLGSSPEYTRRPHIHIAAIDNSLSFPHEHPKGWRSYTYGWLYLPVSIIGRPFSEKTRNHFLPLLTSKAWWEETTFQLRKLFAVDPDFHPKMFARQLAVIKGQAWNIVQSLNHADEGPLELTRRTKVLVWDDEIEVAEDAVQDLPNVPTMISSPKPSINSVPLPRRTRSHSYSSETPLPTFRRTSTDMTRTPRPVPFAANIQKVHPGTTGVTVLEHLERLDAVEAGLQKLGSGVEEQPEVIEVDVVEASNPRPLTIPGTSGAPQSASASHTPATPVAPSPFTPPGSPLPTVQEVESSASSINEEDLAAMSKSTSHVEGFGNRYNPGRWGSNSRNVIDWMQTNDTITPQKRIMIVERLETVNQEPLCSCW
ncbi:hypothetical protein AX16_002036 [Volvariella volvacea WC 439]|nr:hypothetical protein AX16_002036 [Volvariella volvacea WC 439]